MPSWAGGGYGAYTPNPQLTGVVNGLAGDYNNNLTRNVLPAIRRNASAMGQVGSSRQGIAEGLAAGESQTGLANAVAGLYSQDYNNSMNRDLSRYGTDVGAFLTNQGQMLGYDSQQRALDQSQFGLGLQAYGLANQGDWSGLNNAGNIYGSLTGSNNSTTTSGSTGGGWGGLLGGALAGGSFGRQMGWF
jgi:hypothetical protein